MKKLMLSLVAACAALVSFGEVINPDIFTKKCNFTVSGYTGTSTLSDFPVLIRLKADAPVGFNYADCQPDGCDLRFADEAGTLLAHEIDTWNPEGESLIWVKVPALSGTATTVTAYFGAAPTAVPPATPRAVWSKYVTVIHGGTAIADSSANNLTLTANGMSVTAAGGAVGGGMTKEKKKKGINIPNPYTADLFTNKRQYSMSFWAKVETSSLSGVTYVTLGGVENWGNGGFLGLFEKNNGWSVAVSGNHHYDGTKGALPAKTWTYTAFSYDTEAGNYTSYSNGALLKAWEKTNTYTDAGATYWTFGGYSNKEADDNFYGELDEYRIYDGIASADWFKAEYDSANNAAFAVGAPVMDIEETPEPSIACVQTVQTLTALGLDITVTGFGEDATSCDLHAVLASDSAYSDVLDSFDLTAAAVELAKGYPIGAEGLHFGTPYYLKVTATNDKDQTAIVEKIVETLPEPPCKMTFDKEKTDDTFVSFFWSVSSLGELSTFAAVSIEWDTSDSFSTASSQVIVEKLESATNRTRVVVRDLTPSQTYYFRLKTVNECGIVAYSQILSATTESKASNTLIWANLGTDMNDPMNWVEHRLPTKDDYAYFVGRAEVQPCLTKGMEIGSVYFLNYAEVLDVEESNGYCLTAEDGAVLTLARSGDKYAVKNQSHDGVNTIEAPILLTGNNPFLGAWYGDIRLDGSVTTSGEYTQEVRVEGGGSGMVVFGAANPDFKPSKLYPRQTGRIGFTDPQAFFELKTLTVSTWAAGDDKTVHFANLTGEVVNMPNLEKIDMGDTDCFAVDGGAILASNCVFQTSDRGTSMAGDGMLLVKQVVNAGNNNEFYVTCNSGAIVVLEDFTLSDSQAGKVGSLRVNNGMYCPIDFAKGFPTAPDSHNRFNGDAGRKPVLGINEDVSVRLAYNGGVFFGHTNNQDKDGGFAAMGGDRHLTLLDANGDKFDPVAMNVRALDATDDKSAWATPSSLVVGNKWASGTVIFENNFSFPKENTVYAYQGTAPVAGRFVRDITVDSSGRFYKNGDGALAIEGTMTMAGNEFHVREGGLLVNTDLSGLGAQIRLDGSAWIGGTGTVAHIHKESGGATDLAAIRPGEFGKGTLTVKGTKNSKFAANTGVIVDITAKGTTGLLKLEGDINTYSSGWSGYWMRIEPQEGAPAGKYKIMDWTDSTGTPNNIKLIKADSYTVQYDETKVKKAELVVDGTAMYLKFRPVTKGGCYIFVK